MTRTFAEVMDELNSVENVGKFLADQGVKGRRREACECPVAVYLKRETGAARTDVTTEECSVTWWDGSFELIDNAHPVTDFVKWFDRGYYPHMEASS